MIEILDWLKLLIYPAFIAYCCYSCVKDYWEGRESKARAQIAEGALKHVLHAKTKIIFNIKVGVSDE
ncbi:hypothetical protein LCGC14_0452320 [marine sediment metagenome]|uniref:Uncharacterized protein n=1 Tax=marine sediment metagenome TaxID=412755 RepID=A0A0F9V4C4_9ZZZZ